MIYPRSKDDAETHAGLTVTSTDGGPAIVFLRVTGAASRR
jgi:hypothetical protein